MKKTIIAIAITASLAGCAADGSFSAGQLFSGLSGGLRDATTYWNNSAAQTQRSTVNLTPGMTNGNQVNCIPDNRGGYACR